MSEGRESSTPKRKRGRPGKADLARTTPHPPSSKCAQLQNPPHSRPSAGDRPAIRGPPTEEGQEGGSAQPQPHRQWLQPPPLPRGISIPVDPSAVRPAQPRPALQHQLSRPVGYKTGGAAPAEQPKLAGEEKDGRSGVAGRVCGACQIGGRRPWSRSSWSPKPEP